MTEGNRNPWDECAVAYGQWIARREQADLSDDPLLSRMLALLGDVAGREVLDACSGEGFFARLLIARGARVTGIDLSPRLIQMAREKDPAGAIDYRVGDLIGPLPELEGRFDAVASYMALNDVADHQGFATTLAALVKPGARVVLAFNNPYSLLVRGEGHITDYFARGAMGAYGGLAAAGVKARYYHRTLEDYLDTFLDAGFRLAKLVDVPDRPARPDRPWLLPKGYVFPRFMILAFEKPVLGAPPLPTRGD
ncbi:MAG: class I SAM-dependent methyltransferase [Chloroflexota bacterium]